MNHKFLTARHLSIINRWITCAIILAALTNLSFPAHAAPPHKKRDVSQELVKTETGFYEAWKTKDLDYFRTHITANGVSWGEAGTLSRDQQIEAQLTLAKSCEVEGYNLSDFRMMQLATGAYLLTYKLEQYATCASEKMPVHMNGSSVYVLKEGHWQAIYRAEIPLARQTSQ